MMGLADLIAIPNIAARLKGGCLYGFAGDQVEVRGYIELRTTFTDGLVSRTEKVRYLVVNAPSAYNILLGGQRSTEQELCL